jgi:hypothetical protein
MLYTRRLDTSQTLTRNTATKRKTKMYENGQGVSQGDRIESRVAENVFVACMKPIESEDIRERGYLMGDLRPRGFARAEIFAACFCLICARRALQSLASSEMLSD